MIKRSVQVAPVQGTHPVMLHAFEKLNREDLGASEWYLYNYLLGIMSLKGANPFRTAVHQLRSSWTCKGRVIHPCKMAVNTMKASLELLEGAGLIRIDRTEEGRVVHLDIHIL